MLDKGALSAQLVVQQDYSFSSSLAAQMYISRVAIRSLTNPISEVRRGKWHGDSEPCRVEIAETTYRPAYNCCCVCGAEHSASRVYSFLFLSAHCSQPIIRLSISANLTLSQEK